MRAVQTLRGSKAYRGLFLSGKRVDGRCIRCYYTKHGGVGVTVGVAILARGLNAVQRNHLKRRMREAIRREYQRLTQLTSLQKSGLHLLIAYRGVRAVETKRVTFGMIHSDVVALCKEIETRLS